MTAAMASPSHASADKLQISPVWTIKRLPHHVARRHASARVATESLVAHAASPSRLALRR
eukprot:scaffold126802_cov31-Tisochrysis_lutea.AAC.2